MRYYILVGDPKTWDSAFSSNLWGFTEKSKGSWNTTNEGDLVAFYVTSPLKRIVGFGKITEKFVSDEIFWPDEKFFKKALWKYRVRFDVLYLLKDFNRGIEPPKNLMLNQGRKPIAENLFTGLIDVAEKTWKTNIQKHLK
ncbi:MAG: hypothetical protein QW303_05620 [Nitrososphaerota archaeon]